ncbi:MAG TPA: hypothetical protein VF062_28540 [Candidatus Limnocylindrales bacterium]
MRLVVGPLPASVYWRRRALVLGGVVLVVFMIVYSCGKAGESSNDAGVTPSPKPSNTAVSTPTQNPSRAPVAPAGQLSTSPAASPPVVAEAQVCTNAELTVTAQPARTTLPRGAELPIKLLIKNTSGRTCSRDIGPDQQELYIKLGTSTQTVFSSDHCDGPTGSEMRSFPPGHERSYDIVWNGKSSSSCSTTSKRTPDGPTPDAGDYQLFGRVGSDLSEPVTVKLT